MIPYCWPQRKRPSTEPAGGPIDSPTGDQRLEAHLLRIISLLESLVQTQKPQLPSSSKPATPGYLQELKAKLGQRKQG